jgi:hypothetical protein
MYAPYNNLWKCRPSKFYESGLFLGKNYFLKLVFVKMTAAQNAKRIK